jgi:hypothetical protein
LAHGTPYPSLDPPHPKSCLNDRLHPEPHIVSQRQLGASVILRQFQRPSALRVPHIASLSLTCYLTHSMSRPSDHLHPERPPRVPATDRTLHPFRAASQRLSTPRTPTPCPCDQPVASPIVCHVSPTMCTPNAHIVPPQLTCRLIPTAIEHPHHVPATDLLPHPMPCRVSAAISTQNRDCERRGQRYLRSTMNLGGYAQRDGGN